jgi:hypothetical protein
MVTPAIRIFDTVKAKEFYLGYLGFKTDWETPVRRQSATLHPGFARRTMTGVEACHRELSSKGLRPLAARSGGVRMGGTDAASDRPIQQSHQLPRSQGDLRF